MGDDNTHQQFRIAIHLNGDTHILGRERPRVRPDIRLLHRFAEIIVRPPELAVQDRRQGRFWITGFACSGPKRRTKSLFPQLLETSNIK